MDEWRWRIHIKKLNEKNLNKSLKQSLANKFYIPIMNNDDLNEI